MIACLDRGERTERAGASGPRALDQRAQGRERWHRCRTCRAPLARESDELAIGGEVLHAAINPAGYYHAFATVARCENGRALPPPTLEATWFPGYAWEIVACAVCGADLGWRWRSVDGGAPAEFHGLRVDELASDDEPAPHS